MHGQHVCPCLKLEPRTLVPSTRFPLYDWLLQKPGVQIPNHQSKPPIQGSLIPLVRSATENKNKKEPLTGFTEAAADAARNSATTAPIPTRARAAAFISHCKKRSKCSAGWETVFLQKLLKLEGGTKTYQNHSNYKSNAAHGCRRVWTPCLFQTPPAVKESSPGMTELAVAASVKLSSRRSHVLGNTTKTPHQKI